MVQKLALFGDDTALLQDVEYWRGGANESISPNGITKKLGMILGNAGRTFNLIGKEIPRALRLSLSPSYDTDALLRDVDYATMMKITVPIPTGMIVTYMSYAQAIESALLYMSGLETDVLTPCYRLLNRLYGTPEEFRALLNIPEVEAIKTHYGQFKEKRGQVGSCFDSKRTNTYAYYGDVFASHGEYRELENKIHTIRGLVEKISVKDILKQVKAIEDVAGDLHALLKDDSNILPSTKIASDLTEMLFEVAEEVEFLGALLTFVQTLVTTYTDTRSQLSKKLK